MQDFNKNYQLFLSKDFEFFNAFKEIEFKNRIIAINGIFDKIIKELEKTK